MAKQNYTRYKKGSGCYTCIICGKKTRETGYGESAGHQCKTCWDLAGWENDHNDYHREEPNPNCPFCRS